LCLFARRGAKRTDALCHPEKGAHTPVLSVPVKQVELAANQWQPDLVAHDSAGEEIGIWSLADQAFELGVGNEDRSWRGDTRGFRMQDFHPGIRPVSEAEADTVLFDTSGKGARVTINAGAFRFEADPTIRVKVRQRGVEQPAANYASAVTWEGTLDDPKSGDIKLPVNRKGEALKLKRIETVSLQITNVAKMVAPDSLAHFDCYYDFLEDVRGVDRISLLAALLDVDVYDCIPPTDG
jgi:hypothetical protein